MKSSFRWVPLASVLIASASSTASAALLSYNDTVITGEPSVLNTGTLIVANNLGASPAATTINGVPFGTSQANFTGGAGASGDFSTHFAAGSPLDIVLSDVRQSIMTLTLSGLTIGQQYRLQLLMADNVQTPLSSRDFDVTVDGTTFRETVPKTSTGAKNLIATFTPTTTTVSVVFNNPNDNPVLNGYALHAVPEPATAALSALAAVGLLARRRRQSVGS